MLRFVPLFLSACSFEVSPLAVGSDPGAAPAADLADESPDLGSAPDLAAPIDLAVSPSLAGEHADIPPAVDLTAEGILDWVHYGLYAAGDVNRKSGGPHAIARVATGTPTQWPTYGRTFTWSNGAPIGGATTTAGIYVRGNGNGFQLTVPCDGASHTLRIYTTNYYSTARLVAHLDGATDYTDDNSYYRYTLAFRGPAGTMLQVSWKMTNDREGSVDLFGATLY